MLALALFERPDLAIEWRHWGMAAFIEALIESLPDALVSEFGEEFDCLNPEWSGQAANFVAQRPARRVDELIEHEDRLGEFLPIRI